MIALFLILPSSKDIFSLSLLIFSEGRIAQLIKLLPLKAFESRLEPSPVPGQASLGQLRTRPPLFISEARRTEIILHSPPFPTLQKERGGVVRLAPVCSTEVLHEKHQNLATLKKKRGNRAGSELN